MKLLFTIDLKDYDPNWEKFYRPSVRGVIFDDKGNVAMIYSGKCHFYKFPGGGIEGNETHLETLMREIKEETGMTLIPKSVREFGEVLKIQKGHEGGILCKPRHIWSLHPKAPRQTYKPATLFRDKTADTHGKTALRGHNSKPFLTDRHRRSVSEGARNR